MLFFVTAMDFWCSVSQDNRCNLITLTKHLKKLAMLDVLILGIVVVVLSGSVYRKQGPCRVSENGRVFLNGIGLPCIVMGKMMINYPIFGYPMFRQTHVWFIYVCLCIPYIYVIYVYLLFTQGSLNILDSKSVWLALLTARLRKQDRVNACFLLSINMAISRKKIDDSLLLCLYVLYVYVYTQHIWVASRRLPPAPSELDRQGRSGLVAADWGQTWPSLA